jgi:phosphoribosyl 1,2-cyclic phosphodiesterase
MSSPEVLSNAPSMTVHFWGVRGSVPCPGADCLKYGGDTKFVAATTCSSLMPEPAFGG